MKDYKKATEEAAHEDFSYGAKSSVGSGTRSMYENKKQSFIHGAKSEAAKEFHQQGMYSEEEVLKLLVDNLEVYLDWVDDGLRGKLCEKPKFSEWFEQNKKK